MALVQMVLINSTKLSTRWAYLAKLKKFSLWASRKGALPNETPLPLILGSLLNLKKEGLMVLSIQAQLAMISAFHPPVNGWIVFANLICSWFLKGQECLYPGVLIPPRCVNPCLPGTYLILLLSRLMRAPYEPIATYSLLQLSSKVIFLVAITLVRRFSEVRALTSKLPYTVFFKDKV